MNCPDIDDLVRYMARSADTATADHVKQCASCHHVLSLAFKARQEGVTSRTLTQEIFDFRTSVDTLLTLPPSERLRAATANDEYLRVSIAERFSQLAVSQWERDLDTALSHSQVATAIFDRLLIRENVADSAFEAWKNLSTIERERGEYDAAFTALRRASALLLDCTDSEYKDAILTFAEAAICSQRDVWEPSRALALLNQCAVKFEQRQDAQRLRSVSALRGRIYWCAEDYETAHRFWSQAAASVDEFNDAAEYADANRNLAGSLIALGRPDEASELLQTVKDIDIRLRRTLCEVRDDALLAEGADCRGDFDEAVLGYDDVRRRYALAGDREAALLNGKNMAVALVSSGRVGDACVVLRELLADSIRNTARKRFTADALDYLRRLAARDSLSMTVARSVSSYIDRIHRRRPEPFTPPDIYHVM